jgi:hypothetical protein
MKFSTVLLILAFLAGASARVVKDTNNEFVTDLVSLKANKMSAFSMKESASDNVSIDIALPSGNVAIVVDKKDHKSGSVSVVAGFKITAADHLAILEELAKLNGVEVSNQRAGLAMKMLEYYSSAEVGQVIETREFALNVAKENRGNGRNLRSLAKGGGGGGGKKTKAPVGEPPSSAPVAAVTDAPVMAPVSDYSQCGDALLSNVAWPQTGTKYCPKYSTVSEQDNGSTCIVSLVYQK